MYGDYVFKVDYLLLILLFLSAVLEFGLLILSAVLEFGLTLTGLGVCDLTKPGLFIPSPSLELDDSSTTMF